VPTKIKAVDDDGKIIAFDSIRAAGRAGFTISRVHRAIYSGQRHKGLKWYLSGKLDALPAFMAARFDLAANGWTNDRQIHAAFVDALAPDEDLGSGQWDFWEFQQALWRVISPRPYNKAGNVRGLFVGEQPTSKSEPPSSERSTNAHARGDSDDPTPSEPSEQG
jgi:hypothetical protein